MRTVTKGCCLLLLVVAPLLEGCKSPLRGTHVNQHSDPLQDLTDCGPPLSSEDVIAIVQHALDILWGNPSLVGFDIWIEPMGCDYDFFAIRKGTEAAEDIYFRIDRSRRITSVPECWWLGELGNCTIKEELGDNQSPPSGK